MVGEYWVIKPWWNTTHQSKTGRFSQTPVKPHRATKAALSLQKERESSLHLGAGPVIPIHRVPGQLLPGCLIFMREARNAELYTKHPKFKCLNLIHILKTLSLVCLCGPLIGEGPSHCPEAKRARVPLWPWSGGRELQRTVSLSE